MGQYPHPSEHYCAECNGTGYQPLRAGVELAAYLGHEVARVVDGWSAGRNGRVYFENESGATVSLVDANMLDVLGHEAWSQWISGLSSQPRPVLVRCAFAAAVRAFDKESARSSSVLLVRGKDRCRRALESVARWILDPSEEHLEACKKEARAIPQTMDPDPFHLPGGATEEQEIDAAFDAFSRSAWAWAPARIAWEGNVGGYFVMGIQACLRLTDEPTIRAALLSDVAPWALGERDAVREWLGS